MSEMFNTLSNIITCTWLEIASFPLAYCEDHINIAGKT